MGAFLLAAMLLIPALAQATPPALRAGSLAGEDGAALQYLFRPGRAPAIVLVHGRGLGPAGFFAWRERLFPERALLILKRRGYGGSALGSLNDENLGRLNASDVRLAMAEAAKLTGGGRVCVLAVSLGALLLPKLPAAEVRWLALVNPGMPGLVGYLSPQEAAAALATVQTYSWSRFWFPPLREAWLESAGRAILSPLPEAIRDNFGGSPAGRAMVEEVERGLKDPAFLRLILRESVWAALAGRERDVESEAPVFIGLSQDDPVIPAAAYQELIARLEKGGAVKVARWPGGHLAPLGRPELFLDALERFDRETPGP